jgi:methionine--tRNA ligase beta chain
MEISFDDFKKLDMRMGEVKEAEKVPGSRNLIKLTVDFGSETRQCVAGLMNYYQPDELVGKKFVFVINMEERAIMGIDSQCMILAAEDNMGNVALITSERDIVAGSKIG